MTASLEKLPGQLDLFNPDPCPPRLPKVLDPAVSAVRNSSEFMLSDQYDEKHCLEHVKTDSKLWDLRFWKKDHDKQEVFSWLCLLFENPYNDLKCCGHTALCLHKLLTTYNRDILELADLVLANDRTYFHNLLGSWTDCNSAVHCNHIPGKCAECFTPIIFIPTINSKKMPAELSPCFLSAAQTTNSNITFLVSACGETIKDDSRVGYIPHWFTCANPSRFNKKKSNNRC